MFDRTLIGIDNYRNEVNITLRGLRIEGINDTLVNALVDEIRKNLKSEDSKILINMAGEGFNPYYYETFSYLIPKIIEKTNFSLDKFLMITGVDPVGINVEFYKNHVKKHNLLELNIQFENAWEDVMARNIRANLNYYEKLNNLIKLKNKKFLCFNNNPRPHRLYLLANILKYDLLKDSYCSFLFGFPNLTNVKNRFEFVFSSEFPHYFHNELLDLKEVLEKNIDLFPLTLENDKNPNPKLNIGEDQEYFENSYFSIITETSFFNDFERSANELESYDGFFFTEKIWKPVQAKHPFILVGKSNCLEILREKGYKTFHPYINEDYDKIENNKERLDAIIKEIRRLCSFTNDEWLVWLNNIFPIVKHNYELLKTKNLETLIFNFERNKET